MMLASSHTTTSPSEVAVSAVFVPGMKMLAVNFPTFCLKSAELKDGEM